MYKYDIISFHYIFTVLPLCRLHVKFILQYHIWGGRALIYCCRNLLAVRTQYHWADEWPGRVTQYLPATYSYVLMKAECNNRGPLASLVQEYTKSKPFSLESTQLAFLLLIDAFHNNSISLKPGLSAKFNIYSDQISLHQNH